VSPSADRDRVPAPQADRRNLDLQTGRRGKGEGEGRYGTERGGTETRRGGEGRREVAGVTRDNITNIIG
jgi:hypothetical protein